MLKTILKKCSQQKTHNEVLDNITQSKSETIIETPHVEEKKETHVENVEAPIVEHKEEPKVEHKVEEKVEVHDTPPANTEKIEEKQKSRTNSSNIVEEKKETHFEPEKIVTPVEVPKVEAEVKPVQDVPKQRVLIDESKPVQTTTSPVEVAKERVRIDESKPVHTTTKTEEKVIVVPVQINDPLSVPVASLELPKEEIKSNAPQSGTKPPESSGPMTNNIQSQGEKSDTIKIEEENKKASDESPKKPMKPNQPPHKETSASEKFNKVPENYSERVVKTEENSISKKPKDDIKLIERIDVDNERNSNIQNVRKVNSRTDEDIIPGRSEKRGFCTNCLIF